MSDNSIKIFIGLLAAILLFLFSQFLIPFNDEQAKVKSASLAKAIEEYFKKSNGQPPSSIKDLKGLTGPSIKTPFCGQFDLGHKYSCKFGDHNSYEVTAKPHLHRFTGTSTVTIGKWTDVVTADESAPQESLKISRREDKENTPVMKLKLEKLKLVKNTDELEAEEIYLPIWKKTFQLSNGMGEEYFNEHIEVTGTRVENSIIDEDRVTSFYINYVFTHDWIKKSITDSFVYKINEEDLPLTAEELVDHEMTPLLERTKIQNFTHITPLMPIGHMLSKEVISKQVYEDYGLIFDENTQLMLDEDGIFFIRLKSQPLEDDSCWTADLYVDGGTVEEVTKNFQANCSNKSISYEPHYE